MLVLDMRSRFLDFWETGDDLGSKEFRHNFSRIFCGNFEAYFFEGFHQKKIGDFHSMIFRGILTRNYWGFLQHDV